MEGGDGMAEGVGQGLSVRFLGGSDLCVFLLKFCCNFLGGSARVCQRVLRPPPFITFCRVTALITLITLMMIIIIPGAPQKNPDLVTNSGPNPDHFWHLGPDPDQVRNSGP